MKSVPYSIHNWTIWSLTILSCWQNEDDFNRTFEDAAFKLYNFKIRAKMEAYQVWKSYFTFLNLNKYAANYTQARNQEETFPHLLEWRIFWGESIVLWTVKSIISFKYYNFECTWFFLGWETTQVLRCERTGC